MVASGVTYGDIDTGLDRPLTSDEQARLTRWITQAETYIGTRTPAEITLDPEVYKMVVGMAVENRWEARKPSSVTVAVDDANVTRRFENGPSRSKSAWWFLPEWWKLLLPASESGAFSTRPGFVRDSWVESWQ